MGGTHMEASEVFWALLWLTVIVVVAWALWPAKKFACLQCGSIMKMKFCPDHCANCGAYHMRDGKRIRLVGDGDVLDGCFLSVLYDSGPEVLKPDPRKWMWPDQCCICGRHPTRYDTLTVGMRTGYAMGGLQKETMEWKFRVPYCDVHKEGVVWHDDLSENEPQVPIRMALRFKSYDYWKKFKSLNCIQNS
jgi:hypothetical protein